MVGHQGRQADPEVDVAAVEQLPCGAGGHCCAAGSSLGTPAAPPSGRTGSCAEGAFDPFLGGLLRGQLDHAVDEDAGQVDASGWSPTGVDELLDLRDRDLAGDRERAG